MTKYEMTVEANHDVNDEILRYMRESGNWVFERIARGYLDECKWYEHEADMRALSSKFPDVLFTLDGVGEEHPDIWRKFFVNGKMQKCDATLVFDQFDESKLR